jgi:hypothetical protein
MKGLAKYVALAGATIQQRVAFCTAFLLSLVSQILVLLSLFYLWRTLYAGRASMGGYDWPQMETYLVLTFFITAIVGWQSEVFIVVRIQDGSVATDLLKPLDFQGARLAETLGAALFEGLIAGGLAVMIAAALGGVQGNNSRRVDRASAMSPGIASKLASYNLPRSDQTLSRLAPPMRLFRLIDVYATLFLAVLKGKFNYRADFWIILGSTALVQSLRLVYSRFRS